MNAQMSTLTGCCTPWPTPGWPPYNPCVPWRPRPWGPPVCPAPAPVFPGYAEGVATGQATERARLRKRMQEAGIPDSVIDMIVGHAFLGPPKASPSDLEGVIEAAKRAGKRR